MPKFHVNPETGNPGVCEAEIACRFKLDANEHFTSAEAARAAFEERMGSSFSKSTVTRIRDIAGTVRKDAGEISPDKAKKLIQNAPEGTVIAIQKSGSLARWRVLKSDGNGKWTMVNHEPRFPEGSEVDPATFLTARNGEPERVVAFGDVRPPADVNTFADVARDVSNYGTRSYADIRKKLVERGLPNNEKLALFLESAVTLQKDPRDVARNWLTGSQAPLTPSDRATAEQKQEYAEARGYIVALAASR